MREEEFVRLVGSIVLEDGTVVAGIRVSFGKDYSAMEQAVEQVRRRE